jgi:hypothetical protein
MFAPVGITVRFADASGEEADDLLALRDCTADAGRANIWARYGPARSRFSE